METRDLLKTLGAKLPQPSVIAEIDAAIAELLDLRKVAVHIHGGATIPMPGWDTEGEKPRAESAPNNALGLTVAELTAQYRENANSGFHQLRFKTRENYESLLRRLEKDVGQEQIAELNEGWLIDQFEAWSGGGDRIPIARSLIGMLRILATFGVKELQSRDCRELKLTLHDMRFERPDRPEAEKLTREQVEKIITKARDLGLRSIAIAQAFQFECGLKQKDVIGEWVPVSEPGESDVIDHEENMKWLRGLRWEEIDKNMVLRHVTSARGEAVVHDLKWKPLVMEAIAGLKKTGPIVISEKTGKPWRNYKFRRNWRKVANEAGIPKHVKNMDSAAGDS